MPYLRYFCSAAVYSLCASPCRLKVKRNR